MKYIFFDSESIDNKHKYSFTFGYLVTDENFNILKPNKDIVFNPDIQKEDFDWWAYKTLLKDSYPKKEINLTKPFTHFYKKIKKLLSGNDVICIGFETSEDVKYLLENCNRYNLDPINFTYIDVRKIIKYLTGEKVHSLNFEYLKYLNKPRSDIHKSDVDAEMTMQLLKEVLKVYNQNLKDILDKNENLIGTSKDFVYGFGDEKYDIKNSKQPTHEKINNIRVRKTKEGKEDFIIKGSANFILFLRFLDFVKPTQEVEEILKDKKISISLNYELYNFKNMLKLVQLITNAGGTYVKKGTLADIFVKQPNLVLDNEGNPRSCTKHKYVIEAIENEGKNIEIIEFNDLLSILNITKEELDNMPQIDIEYLKDKKYKNKFKL